MKTSCLNDEQVSRLVAGALAAPERADVERHLAECADCAALVAFVVRARGSEVTVEPGAPRSPSPSRGVTLGPGALVERFIVLGSAGAGAMGSVFIAHDPTLDRKVALKLLHEDHADSEHARGRLQREAQALAKLSCKNLVTVFDVLRWNEQVVVALEYVEGSNLRQWLKAEQRSWREVVRVFLEAGRGLAAAHAAGLVHRDFKPDNVLISAADEVKVSDFGLVSTLGADETAEPLDGQPAGELLTDPGALLGTPAYMAPELFRGEPATAQSDQFAFCVALFEGLEGQRPFPSHSLRELARVGGARAMREQTRPIPGWLRKVVQRGLEPNPSNRYPSMEALLSELRRDRQRERARRGGWAASTVLLLAAVATFVRRPPNACGDDQLVLASAWNPPARDAVRRAFEQRGPISATEVEHALTAYVERWDEHVKQLCRPIERGPLPPEIVPFLACLRSAAEDFRAALNSLERGTPDLVSRGPGIIAALEPITACDGLLSLTRLGPVARPPRPSLQGKLRIAELRAEVAAASVHQGLTTAHLALEELAPLDSGIGAEALLLLGRLEAASGQFPLAEDHARQASLAAHQPPPSPRQLADAWLTLATLLSRDARGETDTRLVQAEYLLSLANVLLASLTPDSQLEARLEGAKAEVALARGELAVAVAASERALRQVRAMAPPDLLEVAEAESRMGRVLLAAGEPGRARQTLEALLERGGLPPFLAGSARVTLAEALLSSSAPEGELAAQRAEAQRQLKAAGTPGEALLKRLERLR